MDTQVVVVVEVQVVPVEEVVVKEEAAVVVQGVAARQEAHQRAQVLAQEALLRVQEGNLGLTRVPLLAVVQGGLAGEMQQVEEEVVRVEEEEEEEEEGKVPAVEEALRPPLEGSQAMVPPTETTPLVTTMDLLLGHRPSLVMAPLVGTEASHPSTATTGKAGSSGKSTSNRSSKTLRLRRGQRLLKRNMANISDG